MTQRPRKHDAAPHESPAQSAQSVQPTLWPQPVSPGFQEAWGHLQSGRLAEAESGFRHLLQQDAAQPFVAHFLGVVLHQLGRSHEGLTWVQSSLVEMPRWSEGHNTLGNLLAAMGRRDEAIAAFMAALEIEPRYAVAWNNLGALLLQDGNVDGARMALQNAVDIDPTFRDAQQNLGDAHTRAGDAHAAALSYCAEYVLRPPDPAQRHMLGIAYNQLGRHAEAAEVFRAWLQDEPGHPIAAHLLAASQGDSARQRASDAYLQAYFDGFAESFEGKLLGALGYRVPTAVNEAVRALKVPPRSLRVLDLGCGTGLCGGELAPFAQWMVGVDLSAKSLDKARSKGVYDQLVHGEIVGHLASAAASAYDLVVAADTLIYFGAIEGLVRGVGHVLTPGGWFIASLEVLSVDASTPYAIQPSGRYSHRLDHVQQVLADAGMQLLRASPLNLRHELGRPVQGVLVVSQRVAGEGC